MRVLDGLVATAERPLRGILPQRSMDRFWPIQDRESGCYCAVDGPAPALRSLSAAKSIACSMRFL